jgi:hypothetical protein
LQRWEVAREALPGEGAEAALLLQKYESSSSRTVHRSAVSESTVSVIGI